MNTSAQAVENTKQPLKILLLRATADEQGLCRKIIEDSDLFASVSHVSDQASLEQTLSAEQWDQLLIFRLPKEVTTQQIASLVHERGSETTLLLLNDDPRGDVSVQALRDGVADTVSLDHQEHLVMVIKRETRNLATRRELKQQHQTSEETPPLQSEPTNNRKDLLTGLYNQRFFITGTQQLLKKQPPCKVFSHSILYVTLDRADTIRARVGIAVTDIIIADIAQCIRAHIQSCYPVARYEDAFVVLLHKVNPEKAQNIARTLREKIATHITDVISDDVPNVTCSIGISIADQATDNAQQFINSAQMACEAASAEGGNRIHLFDPEGDRQYSNAREQKWTEHVRGALTNNRFKLLYQPIVSMKSGGDEAYEILLRMLDNDDQEIMPADFMPHAAKAGLMPAIDRWVTHNAIRELIRRREESQQNTTLFIKLDHTTVNDKQFLHWLGKQLQAALISGDELVFEISERSDIRDPLVVEDFITQLKTLSCRCTIEHFGDNEGSLERLHRLSLDFIKVDRNLIQRISEDEQIRSKVKQLILAAHIKKTQAIAEFVQDAHTLKALWYCDMDYIQGYFLQRPDAVMDYDFTE